MRGGVEGRDSADPGFGRLFGEQDVVAIVDVASAVVGGGDLRLLSAARVGVKDADDGAGSAAMLLREEAEGALEESRERVEVDGLLERWYADDASKYGMRCSVDDESALSFPAATADGETSSAGGDFRLAKTRLGRGERGARIKRFSFVVISTLLDGSFPITPSQHPCISSTEIQANVRSIPSPSEKEKKKKRQSSKEERDVRDIHGRWTSAGG